MDYKTFTDVLHAIRLVEADGEGHNLPDRDKFPLLHKVLDGVRAEIEKGII